MKQIVLLAVLLVAACAQPPEAIAPAYVSPATYRGYNCQQLGAELHRVDNALAQASQQQRKARSNDTAGVILLGLPVSSLSGANVAEQVAALKGQKHTLEQMMISRRCVRR